MGAAIRKVSVLQYSYRKLAHNSGKNDALTLVWQMVASVFYVPCLAFAKLSILFLYRKLGVLKWFRICVYTLMAIVATYSIGIIFALIFPCQPVAANWDLSITDYQCVDEAGIYLATAAVNVITDVLILTLPIPMILRLQMPKSQKLALMVVLAVGSAWVYRTL